MGSANFKEGLAGQQMPAGRISKSYFNDRTADAGIAVTVPPGAEWYKIYGNAQVLVFEVHSAARIIADDDGGLAIAKSAIPLAADADGAAVFTRAMRPCAPGQIINVGHSDGATAIGEIRFEFEGGLELPDPTDATPLTIVQTLAGP